MQIAGITARVQSLYECTPAFFRPYLTEAPAAFAIELTQADLDFEGEFLRREALEEGFRPRVFTEQFLERAAIQRCFAEFLFDRSILLLHGSTVAVDGKAYLFTAASGTGKSTHTRLWRQLFGDRAMMINDDKPFVQLTESGIFAWGSPWSGKHGLDSNVRAALQGICLLERGSKNHIEKADASALLPVLYHQCCRPAAPEKDAALRQLLRDLTLRTPLWHMHCTKDIQAAEIAWAAMSK